MKDTKDKEYEHYNEIIGAFRTIFLVTSDNFGNVKSRPMMIADIDELNDTIWFFASEDSKKVQQILNNPKCAVIGMDSSKMISISGSTTLIQNKNKMIELWKGAYLPWFPEGVDSPNISLLEFKPNEAEYWDGSGMNALKYIFQSAKAIISGSTIKIQEPSQHGQVGFRPL